MLPCYCQTQGPADAWTPSRFSSLVSRAACAARANSQRRHALSASRLRSAARSGDPRGARGNRAGNDFTTSVKWYEILFGCPADSRPMPEVAQWTFTQLDDRRCISSKSAPRRCIRIQSRFVRHRIAPIPPRFAAGVEGSSPSLSSGSKVADVARMLKAIHAQQDQWSRPRRNLSRHYREGCALSPVLA